MAASDSNAPLLPGRNGFGRRVTSTVYWLFKRGEEIRSLLSGRGGQDSEQDGDSTTVTVRTGPEPKITDYIPDVVSSISKALAWLVTLLSAFCNFMDLPPKDFLRICVKNLVVAAVSFGAAYGLRYILSPMIHFCSDYCFPCVRKGMAACFCVNEADATLACNNHAHMQDGDIIQVGASIYKVQRQVPREPSEAHEACEACEPVQLQPDNPTVPQREVRYLRGIHNRTQCRSHWDLECTFLIYSHNRSPTREEITGLYELVDTKLRSCDRASERVDACVRARSLQRALVRIFMNGAMCENEKDKLRKNQVCTKIYVVVRPIRDDFGRTYNAFVEWRTAVAAAVGWGVRTWCKRKLCYDYIGYESASGPWTRLLLPALP